MGAYSMRIPIFSPKKPERIPYDPAEREPAVRRSICTGEMTGGFVERKTGKFQDYLLLDGEKELQAFCESVGVKPEELKTVY